MRRRRAALGLGGGALVAVLVGGQVLLPRLAERRVRRDLASTGTVTAVHVHALPAVKLLWGRADRVEVTMDDARVGGGGGIATLVRRTAGTDEVDARVGVLRAGPLLAREVTFAKRGRALAGEALVREADLAAALPPQLELRAAAAGSGGLELQVAVSVFGARAVIGAQLEAVDGALAVVPQGLLGGFATLRLFSDPRVRVDRVSASERPGAVEVTVAGALGG